MKENRQGLRKRSLFNLFLALIITLNSCVSFNPLTYFGITEAALDNPYDLKGEEVLRSTALVEARRNGRLFARSYGFLFGEENLLIPAYMIGNDVEISARPVTGKAAVSGWTKVLARSKDGLWVILGNGSELDVSWLPGDDFRMQDALYGLSGLEVVEFAPRVLDPPFPGELFPGLPLQTAEGQFQAVMVYDGANMQIQLIPRRSGWVRESADISSLPEYLRAENHDLRYQVLPMELQRELDYELNLEAQKPVSAEMIYRSALTLGQPDSDIFIQALSREGYASSTYVPEFDFYSEELGNEYVNYIASSFGYKSEFSQDEFSITLFFARLGDLMLKDVSSRELDRIIPVLALIKKEKNSIDPEGTISNALASYYRDAAAELDLSVLDDLYETLSALSIKVPNIPKQKRIQILYAGFTSLFNQDDFRFTGGLNAQLNNIIGDVQNFASYEVDYYRLQSEPIFLKGEAELLENVKVAAFRPDGSLEQSLIQTGITFTNCILLNGVYQFGNEVTPLAILSDGFTQYLVPAGKVFVYLEDVEGGRLGYGFEYVEGTNPFDSRKEYYVYPTMLWIRNGSVQRLPLVNSITSRNLRLETVADYEIVDISGTSEEELVVLVSMERENRDSNPLISSEYRIFTIKPDRGFSQVQRIPVSSRNANEQFTSEISFIRTIAGRVTKLVQYEYRGDTFLTRFYSRKGDSTVLVESGPFIGERVWIDVEKLPLFMFEDDTGGAYLYRGEEFVLLDVSSRVDFFGFEYKSALWHVRALDGMELYLPSIGLKFSKPE
jgi:hypothetical protein